MVAGKKESVPLRSADVEECDKVEDKGKLDLVFVMDNTGSMGSWIKQAQQHIRRIVMDIVASEKSDVRFALVTYRDHPPQDSSFVTQVHGFTTNQREMQNWVNEMSANGGGDGPEAVADGLHEALTLEYRPDAAKFVVVVADAPPHGLGCGGDGFPNGCPLGHDPLDIARGLAKKGITLYSVVCGNFEGQAFFQAIAHLTGGQYVPLASASLLAQVIIGGAQEEITLERLMAEAQEAVQQEQAAAGADLDDDVLAERLHVKFQASKTRTRHLQVGSEALPEVDDIAKEMSKLGSLADCRKAGRSYLTPGSYKCYGGDTEAPAMPRVRHSRAAAPAAAAAGAARVSLLSKVSESVRGLFGGAAAAPPAADWDEDDALEYEGAACDAFDAPEPVCVSSSYAEVSMEQCKRMVYKSKMRG
mmetsp:Transcript_20320/g.47479  ORF Transcript_20320/g.47479 Transcript_20320/m.47479 type:complete len:417 (-) Transcript_20320:97-1347(-)|eukprot:CAMPEP_0114554228 /NCGR_PEP_ID=MMETSP0114-20121206/8099_1 /TAXON_ID=31324 /ORGANISM="Goniomonas sp, Strain m" /LENGTH=416 /DNA_ID=CAMNT_0001739263 /DNA_START=93 /DNA_END=1343 /DNA_ORIENTATION=+